MKKLSNGRTVCNTLPKVGDILTLDHFGLVKVIGLSHSSIDNYITLQYLETVIGQPTFTSPFSVG